MGRDGAGRRGRAHVPEVPEVPHDDAVGIARESPVEVHHRTLLDLIVVGRVGRERGVGHRGTIGRVGPGSRQAVVTDRTVIGITFGHARAIADAVQFDVVDAFRGETQRDGGRSHVTGRAGTDISSQHRAGGVQDPDLQSEIRRHERDPGGDHEIAAARVDTDHVDVSGAADDATNGRRETRGERGGLKSSAMIIREQRHA